MNEHFREALMEMVPCSVFMVDTNNRIIYWNRSAEELTLYSAEEIVGLSCDSLQMTLCSTQKKKGRQSLCPLLCEDQSRDIECEIQCKDGSVIPVVRRYRRVYDSQDRLIGAIEALVDVSQIKKARTEIRVLRHEIAQQGRYGNLIGSSRVMRRLYEMIETVANTDASVVIEGETGTGKELVAKTLHAQSRRAGKIFLPLNCGAVPESLLEAELFGNTRGAFTGAVADRAGCFETADGGTLFLDEIGEMPLTAQVKLLRVLQEGQIMRLGESRLRTVNVRVIAATNRALAQSVEAGCFRQDLFYRLRVVGLMIPPLRERKEDLPDLVTHFIEYFNKHYGRQVKGCEPEVMQQLHRHTWPGNVRELEHVIEHAFVVSKPDQQVLVRQMLPVDFGEIVGGMENQSLSVSITKPDERTQVENALREAQGNKAAAARLLGMTRTGLYKKMRRLGM